jgi:hypothetical protein
MTWLAAKGLNVDLQILDNESSGAYKQVITEKWKASFQLTCINATGKKGQSEHSRITSSPSWPEWTPSFGPTCGTRFYRRRSLHSISSGNHKSIQEYQPGSSSKAHLTSQKHLWHPLAVVYSPMPSQQPANHGTTESKTDSTSAQPSTRKGASSW